SPELALVTIIVAPLLVYPVAHFGRRLRGTTHRSQERMADMATLLEETIRGVRIVKAFAMERFEIGRFRDSTKRHLSSNLNAPEIDAVGSGIRYENVSFRYEEDPVITEVDLNIAPGEIVALVGGSGAGKSTFVNLLPRFYDVNGGRITVDGQDIRDVTLASL